MTLIESELDKENVFLLQAGYPALPGNQSLVII